MYIKSMEICNFKSFSGQHNIEFCEGINIFVGNNNAGKSTLLNAFDFLYNGLKRGENCDNLKSRNPEGDEFYVVITLEGNIEEAVAQFVKDEKKRAAIKDCIQNDGLTFRRSFAEDSKAKIIETWDPEEGFKNISGIPASVFQELFSPTFFRVDDTPESILDFSNTKILGKLIEQNKNEFEESKEWADFLESHRKAFSEENGFGQRLSSLADSLSKITQDQFGDDSLEIKLSFSSPKSDIFVKMGEILLHENGSDTSIQEEGSGLQRSIALAAIRLYAQQLHTSAFKTDDSPSHPVKPLFLCVDEPETWLHPRGQMNLSRALGEIGQSEQLWVATHSPYILQGLASVRNTDISRKRTKLFIVQHGDERIKSETEFTKHPTGTPSLAAISYYAFQLPSAEFHSELFGYIQKELGAKTLRSVAEKMRAWKINGEECIREKERLDSRCLDKKLNVPPIVKEPLPVYVRNCIDHPESIAEKKRILDEFQNLPNRGNATPDKIKKLTNEYEAVLGESIQCMLDYIDSETFKKSRENKPKNADH